MLKLALGANPDRGRRSQKSSAHSVHSLSPFGLCPNTFATHANTKCPTLSQGHNVPVKHRPKGPSSLLHLVLQTARPHLTVPDRLVALILTGPSDMA